MKYYHGILEERNDEYEYSYDYLIKARSLEEARQRLIVEASCFYGADVTPAGNESEGQVFEFFGGTIRVSADSIGETTKARFIKHMLQKCEI